MPQKIKYYSLNQYLKDTFGCKVYKLALDGGMTCPNRDGTLGYKGCIFCSEGGSGDFAESYKEDFDIWDQIEKAKQRVSKKISFGKYIAYFQSYTNTYASLEYLEKLFMRAILHPDIAALSIATRPDCLSPEIILLLKKLNDIKPVWVELGLQTIHPKTIEYIRRGYDNDCYLHAVSELKNSVAHIVTHVILGLPGETPEDMLETVGYVVDAGTNGIKLQLLHVLKGTDLASDYEKGLFEVMTLSEYCHLLRQCLEIIPSDVVIHRITGDGPKKLLIAPKWSADKKNVLNTINKYLKGEINE